MEASISILMHIAINTQSSAGQLDDISSLMRIAINTQSSTGQLEDEMHLKPLV